MGREGPCFHCGVEYTPLWRPGPHEKPVLCNACGSRWRNRGTLNDYFPKHANKETQSCLQGKLPSEVKPLVLAQDNRRLKVEEKVVGPDGTSACEEEIEDISCSGSPGSFSGNCIHIQETTGEAVNGPLWNPNSVPRRKRSKLKQYILSPVERLNGQLYCILQKPDFAITSAYEEDILIYEKDKNIPANEIGLGAMLFIPPSTTTEDSKPQSTTAEKDSSYSSYFRNENSSLIEKYLVNHVAIQNGSSANIDGRVEGNKVSLHHTDTRLRIDSQTALRGSKVGHSVRRPRGRPHISTARDTLQSVKRPRGRPRVSTAQDTLQPVKRPRGRPPGATAQDRHQSVKRPRGRPCVSTAQHTLQSVKRPRGSPHVSTAQDTFQSVKRPRGRPHVSTAQGTLQPVKRPRGRPRLSTAQGRVLHSHSLSQTKGIGYLQVQSSTQMDVPLNDTTGIWTIKERKADTLTINIGNNLKLRDCGRIYVDPSSSTSENKLHSEQDGRDAKL